MTPHSRRRRGRLAALLALAWTIGAESAVLAADPGFTPRRRPRSVGSHQSLRPQRLRPEVIESYPHDTQAFTEGLLLHDGVLYESTGLHGESSLRRVDLATGAVLARIDLPPTVFGEGLALVGDRLIVLTWRERRAFVYGLGLDSVGELSYPTEGWGLCFDGQRLLMTDGTDRLYYRDRHTLALRSSVPITLRGRRLPRVNELECVGEHVWANVWPTDMIVEIHKRSGIVRSVVDASGLLTEEERAGLGFGGVLNGIAYDPETDTFLVTGKFWPKMFRVRFVADDAP